MTPSVPASDEEQTIRDLAEIDALTTVAEAHTALAAARNTLLLAEGGLLAVQNELSGALKTTEGRGPQEARTAAAEAHALANTLRTHAQDLTSAAGQGPNPVK